MNLVIDLKELRKKDAPFIGGKATSLGKLICAEINVPPGFVVTTLAFDFFAKENNLSLKIKKILSKINYKSIRSVGVSSKRIQSLINSAAIPKNISFEILEHYKKLNSKFVAVRSSATVEDGAKNSWAGQFDSYLNVSSKDLLREIRQCLASLYNTRAILYRFENKLNNKKIRMAVVIQEMVKSEMSGVAFSAHPITGNNNQIYIEAVHGLADKLVSGLVTPHSYLVEKYPIKICKNSLSLRKQKLLNKSQILNLSKLIIKIEKYFGVKCDVEWALEKGKFYILQNRPITA